MNEEERIGLLKEAKIIDNKELFAKVNIIYSEFGQALRIMSGSTNAGVEGYIGVNEGHLVLFENTLFGGKPKREVFYVPLDQVELVSLKNGLFNITKVLRIKIGAQHYKLTPPGKYKNQIEEIANLLHK